MSNICPKVLEIQANPHVNYIFQFLFSRAAFLKKIPGEGEFSPISDPSDRPLMEPCEPSRKRALHTHKQ